MECAEGFFASGSVGPQLLCGFTIDGDYPGASAQNFEAVVEGCWCGGGISCDARIDGDRTLRIDTLFCADPSIDCDCLDPEAVARFNCAIPRLEEGRWSVVVDGRPAFVIDATGRDVPPDRFESSPICWQTAPREDPEGLTCRWPSTDAMAQRLCHEQEVSAGTPVAIEIGGPNTCLEDRADCQVTVIGDEIRVEPRTRTCLESCPSCELCAPVPIRCTTPPLLAGTYRVRSGRLESRLFALEGGIGRPGTTCAETL